MNEIPLGFGTVPDRTLANMILAPEVLLLVFVSLARGMSWRAVMKGDERGD